MSYQQGDQCYATSVEAAQASATSSANTVVLSGNQICFLQPNWFYKVNDEVTQINWTLQCPSVPDQTRYSWYTAQPCGLVDTADALTISWMIAAVWLSVFAIKFLRRAL